jgi:hypothetical protein
MKKRYLTWQLGGSSVASAARLALAFSLLGLASASAQVFNISGTLSNGAFFGGSITIAAASVTNSNINVGAPSIDLCSGAPVLQTPVSGLGYVVELSCTTGSFVLVLNSDAAGDLTGYAGGPIDPISTLGPFSVSSGSVTPLVAPVITKSFSPTQIFAGQAATLNFLVVNTNFAQLTGAAFTDNLPAGVVVANPNGLTGTCGGTVTAVPGSSTISLSGGVLAGQVGGGFGGCPISVNVIGVNPGVKNNLTSLLTTNEAPSGTAAAATLVVFAAADSSFQVSYAADPAAGESYINIINTGANGASLLGPGFGTQAGNMCINVYAFAPDEQEISCCSCLLTPNSVANLGVNRDLTSTTLTGVVPTSVVIKLVATLAGTGGSGTSCSASAATEGTPVRGLVAYGTTPQPVGTTFSAVEHTFVPSTLSAAEYASITGRCASILGNGSGFGICSSCRAGALGAGKQ